ncbi:MAG: exo-alpha-sialidase, partial [Candidatus Hydrogenedentes bacterium]|nr:exo-alpha-sialidase [Candidatus Hydrogenedentota bacterium]
MGRGSSMSGGLWNLMRVAGLVGIVVIGGLAAQADSSFGDPEPVNTNADTDVELDGDPSVAADRSGNIVAVWSSANLQDNGIGNDGDIFAASSSDSGATWSDPVAITTDDAADQSPVVATDGAGNWVAAWSSDNDLGGAIGADYDILFARSTDNGQTWSTPTFLNSLAPTSNASDFDVTLTANSAGLFIAAWDSNGNVGTGTDTEIHFSRSKNGGGSWGDEAALNPDAATETKFDQQPSLATDGLGNWVAVWLGDGQDSIYEVLSARSSNDGKTWQDLARPRSR